MRVNKKIKERLAQILMSAYAERKAPSASPRFKANTMSRIRRLALEPPPPSFALMFEQLVWRLTPVAGALALIGFIMLLHVNIIPDSAVFQLLMNETEEYKLITQFVL